MVSSIKIILVLAIVVSCDAFWPISSFWPMSQFWPPAAHHYHHHQSVWPTASHHHQSVWPTASHHHQSVTIIKYHKKQIDESGGEGSGGEGSGGEGSGGEGSGESFAKPDTPRIGGGPINDGDNDNFACGGTPDAVNVTAYQFLKDGVERQNSASNTLLLTPATFGRDEGSWTCVAYIGNVASDPSDPIHIRLQVKTTTLTITPAQETVSLGTSITMNCATTASVGTKTYTFYKDGDQQEENSSGHYSFTANPAHSGEWSCGVEVDLGGADGTRSGSSDSEQLTVTS